MYTNTIYIHIQVCVCTPYCAHVYMYMSVYLCTHIQKCDKIYYLTKKNYF